MPEMPQDPLVWALATLAVAAVVVVALVMGGRVEVGLNPPSLKFHRKAEGGKERISVLERAEIEEAKVGAVTGLQRRKAGEEEGPGGASEVEVAKKVKIKGSTIGDISGVVVSGSSKSGNNDKPVREASGSGKGRVGE